MMAMHAMMASAQVQSPPSEPVGSAADHAEGAVDAGDRRPLGEHPDDAAEGEQAAERDDEGGHADVGDDEALEAADEDADADPERQRHDPHQRAADRREAQDVGQEVGHEDGVDHGDDADLRTDREVDVAGHDDEHHARGHDGRAARLHAQRDHVRGTDELAAREDVESDQDDDQRDEHAEQAHVDLGGREQAAQRRSLRAGRLLGRGFGGTAHRPRSPSGLDETAPCVTLMRERRARTQLLLRTGQITGRCAAGDRRRRRPARRARPASSQPPSTTRFRLSWVIGVGCRMNEVTMLPPGVSKSAACSAVERHDRRRR